LKSSAKNIPYHDELPVSQLRLFEKVYGCTGWFLPRVQCFSLLIFLSLRRNTSVILSYYSLLLRHVTLCLDIIFQGFLLDDLWFRSTIFAPSCKNLLFCSPIFAPSCIPVSPGYTTSDFYPFHLGFHRIPILPRSLLNLSLDSIVPACRVSSRSLFHQSLEYPPDLYSRCL
jgi:hypothetical protein